MFLNVLLIQYWCAFKGEINVWDSITFLLLYSIYIYAIFWIDRVNRIHRSKVPTKWCGSILSILLYTLEINQPSIYTSCAGGTRVTRCFFGTGGCKFCDGQTYFELSPSPYIYIYIYYCALINIIDYTRLRHTGFDHQLLIAALQVAIWVREWL